LEVAVSELRVRADVRLARAGEVVRDLELVERWGPYGDVVIVGSVGIGVVVAPDVDLEVWSAEPRVGDGFAVVRELAELPGVRRVTYLDARDRHERGQYWKVEYEFTPDETWTIDTWVFPGSAAASKGAAMAAAVREALAAPGRAGDRDRILAIKEEAAVLGERAYGYWLYQAVLEAGVDSYAGYKAWLGDRNIYERTSWLPRT
jgi:hypothetical protein